MWYKLKVQWIYLSPHLDDAALSCGGLLWEQSQAGDAVSVWTICAGDPPAGPLSPFAASMHERWETGLEAAVLRREEDLKSCLLMGAAHRHFSLPDCIYRRDPATGQPLYASEEAIFAALLPVEEALVQTLAEEIGRHLPKEVQLVCPLTLGNHVDHQLTRAAAERIGRPLWYYADYPYALEEAVRLHDLLPAGWRQETFPISKAGLEAWIRSVSAHASQISSFWEDLPAMQRALRAYCQKEGGARLWRPG